MAHLALSCLIKYSQNGQNHKNVFLLVKKVFNLKLFDVTLVFFHK